MPRAQKVCRVDGCHAPTTATRCTDHQREYEKQRGLPAQRGYTHAYRRAAARVTRDATHCAQCGERFTADNPATGGHKRALRDGGSLAEGIEAQCAKCNLGWRRTGL